ncbi:hypothetical protein KGA65_00840 [Ideonella sp. B7]|uniref:hypothetical protein n=1 Tax=Ideonella benzenivorans TaxID=2831643 RepID=UPI001CECF78C|nr:hypothetical protein [Ideonella benzenivorans]MCA6215073.1 hypothetical protein [Ideonella benzenivorans]
MISLQQAQFALEAAISNRDDVFVSASANADEYFESLERDLRSSLCEPFSVSAQVMAPGFPFAEVGESIEGFCIAHARGYWLVYQPAEERFLCFWGESASNLGAHGVFGTPLGCWAA